MVSLRRSWLGGDMKAIFSIARAVIQSIEWSCFLLLQKADTNSDAVGIMSSTEIVTWWGISQELKIRCLDYICGFVPHENRNLFHDQVSRDGSGRIPLRNTFHSLIIFQQKQKLFQSCPESSSLPSRSSSSIFIFPQTIVCSFQGSKMKPQSSCRNKPILPLHYAIGGHLLPTHEQAWLCESHSICGKMQAA